MTRVTYPTDRTQRIDLLAVAKGTVSSSFIDSKILETERLREQLVRLATAAEELEHLADIPTPGEFGDQYRFEVWIKHLRAEIQATKSLLDERHRPATTRSEEE